MSTWSRPYEDMGCIDPKEIAPCLDVNGEAVDLLRAEYIFKLGMREEAMKLFDSAIAKGSYEAKMCKGFALSEGALEDACFEDMVGGLKLAMPVAMRLMQPAQARRLLKILKRAVDAGWIQGDRQLCVDEVSNVDVYARMEDFVQVEGNENAVLSNLYEYMAAFYR